jgi:gluconolactonase
VVGDISWAVCETPDNHLLAMKNNQRFALSLFLLATCSCASTAEFDIKNEAEFRNCVPADAKVEKLAGDFNFVEGPTWVPADGGYLVFSDIPANQLKKWTKDGGVTTFRQPSNNANGNTTDLEGRLVTAEHSGRRISMTEKDGTVRTLVDQYDGKKFNSPNDVVVKSDGTVWFTDPPYGVPKGEKKEQEGNYVFQYDPKIKKTTVVVKDCDMPNGLCFSPDEKKLYIADSGKPRHIRVFQVEKDGLKNGKVFCAIDKGGPDGIRCDARGRVWSSAGDGVHIFDANGSLLAKILAPESPANLCFGGQDGKTLFIIARKSLYAVQTSVTGAKQPSKLGRYGE